MQTFEYMNPNFRIEDNPCFNNINGLIDISNYLDFGIKTTIHRQIPSVTPEQEKYFATTILKDYMKGNRTVFSRQYGIRQNFDIIGQQKIKYLLLKMLIEKEAINKRTNHMIKPEKFEDQSAEYITNVFHDGQFEGSKEWFEKYIDLFIDEYIERYYGKDPKEKDHAEKICYENPWTAKALEQLNLEMSLNRIKN